jgi:hypothetical protein
VVASAWLHDAACDSPGVEVPFVAGWLASAFDIDRRRTRERWLGVWQRAKPR